MIPIVGAAWKVGLFPVWTLWLGYKGLWWAIKPSDGPSTPGAGSEAGVAGRAAMTPPRGALLGSFVGALGSSVLMAFAFEWLARSERLEGEHAALAWGWLSLAVAMAGLMVVRWSSRPRRSVGDLVRSTAWSARQRAGRVGAVGVRAVQSAASGVKNAWRPLTPTGANVPVESPKFHPDAATLEPRPDRVAKAVGHVVGGAAKGAWSVGGKVAHGGRRAIGRGLARIGKRVAGERLSPTSAA
jgi:hypothetical protein